MHIRKCLENIDEGGPGPSAYHLKPTIGMPKKTDPTFWQSPAFSLRFLTDQPNYVSSPGPVYKVDRMTRHGRDTNAKFPFGEIFVSKGNVEIPGPASYLPCYTNLSRAPTPKILLPLKEREKGVFPAPNKYTVRKDYYDASSPIKSRRKGYTIKWKTDPAYAWETKTINPGPAGYDTVDVNVYKNRGPVVSFGVLFSNKSRQRLIADGHNDNVTLAAERCPKISCGKNCCTFGIKHSPKRFNVIIPADNNYVTV